jgi:hypothetical protein
MMMSVGRCPVSSHVDLLIRRHRQLLLDFVDGLVGETADSGFRLSAHVVEQAYSRRQQRNGSHHQRNDPGAEIPSQRHQHHGTDDRDHEDRE